MLVCVSFAYALARETAGAARTRLSLLPLLFGGAMFMQTSGAVRREKAKVCQPDMPAQAGIQYSETPAMIENSRRTGYPRSRV
jgi:hypothetical protein